MDEPFFLHGLKVHPCLAKLKEKEGNVEGWDNGKKKGSSKGCQMKRI
jgi:hypothetical protein